MPFPFSPDTPVIRLIHVSSGEIREAVVVRRQGPRVLLSEWMGCMSPMAPMSVKVDARTGRPVKGYSESWHVHPDDVTKLVLPPARASNSSLLCEIAKRTRLGG
jgi:hypothetical protein